MLLSDATSKPELIACLIRDPWLAHSTLFRHRHPNPTPLFHQEIVRLPLRRNKALQRVAALRGS